MEWINIKNKLPSEDNIWVVAWLNFGKESDFSTLLYNKGTFKLEGENYTNYVTYWMIPTKP